MGILPNGYIGVIRVEIIEVREVCVCVTHAA